MPLLSPNPRIQLITVPTPHGTDYLRAMILEEPGAKGALLARVEDVGIFSDVTYHDMILVKRDGDAFSYISTLEHSTYNAYVCLAGVDDTIVGPRLIGLDATVAGRVVHVEDVAIVSVAAPPAIQPALERELGILLREKHIRDLVRIVNRSTKAAA